MKCDLNIFYFPE